MESLQSQNLISNKLKPQIITYLSITDFLKDYYNYRKQTDPKFSYEIWSSELGFKSKSSTRLICLGGKFISNLFIESFSQQEQLTEDEKEQFKLLANYRNCDDPAIKKTFLNRIIERHNLTKNETQLNGYTELLSSIDTPILQLIISFSDVVPSIQNLQRLTNMEIPQIEKNLFLLEKMGLIQSYFSEEHQELLWKSNVPHFRIENPLEKEAINCFHNETTKEIAGALKLETALKKFRSIYFSLSDQTYTELSDDIEQFITKLVNKYGNNSLIDKSLFKINVQAYPVTEKLTHNIKEK